MSPFLQLFMGCQRTPACYEYHDNRKMKFKNAFEKFPVIAGNSLFGSVVAVAFQIAFRAKMHANDVFLFFKNHF
jgi:hypothetical protein